uniref:GT23 domain-containing protein n=2 Tax=Trichobilharzia regenti TaxID=157069 RepID=A0AA85JSJ6_TRIRE|nr:unnamed protein product [Trichobilharzia regenti]CAH8822570.1 unnamed protein product [Trichobilharzia regenti]
MNLLVCCKVTSKHELMILLILWLPLLPLLHLYTQRYFNRSVSTEINGCRRALLKNSIDSKEKTEWINQSIFSLRKLADSFPFGYSHEILRRRAIHYVHEMNYTLNSLQKQLADLQKLNETIVDNATIFSLGNDLSKFQQHVTDILFNVERVLNQLGQVDGFSEERNSKLNEISQIVQKRIRQLQNPADCTKAKFMTFNFTNLCGFGCSIHQLSYCLQLSLMTGRVLVVNKHETGDIFREWLQQNILPISDNCSYRDITFESNSLECPYLLYGPANNNHWIPNILPSDLAIKLFHYHEAPYVWFAGQLAAFILRPKPHLAELIKETVKEFKSKHHLVVGVHVRRTDKLKEEAAFHDLTEYMKHVESYFDSMNYTSQSKHLDKFNYTNEVSNSIHHFSENKRSVYLTTDETSVFEEISKLYPHYIVYGSPNRSQSAAMNSRQSIFSMTNAFVDIIALSQTDILVCTLSSNVCRLAYELMQTRHEELGDATQLVRSLDYMHHSEDYSMIKFDVIIPDVKTNLHYNDEVYLYRNYWNGTGAIKRIEVNEKNLIEFVASARKTSFLLPSYKLRPRYTIANVTWS